MAPVFVVAPGRSGTSVVARILHTQLGIFMGEKFREFDKDNPDGYWEDLEFKDRNDDFMNGKITYPEWEAKIKKLIELRQKTYKYWGLKDPRLCYLLGFYLQYVDTPTIIRCIRDNRAIVKSIIRCYGWAKTKADFIVEEAQSHLDMLLRNFDVVHIDFNIHLDDEMVKLKLAEGGFSL